jgi:ribonucleoside-triphosphate reductase
MPRIACDFGYDIDKILEFVRFTGIINNARRNIIQDRVNSGAHPLYTLDFIKIKTQYSTTGLNGIYEFLEINGFDILEEEGQQALIKVMEAINEELNVMQKKYDAPHNTEQVPGENMSVKACKKDHFFGKNKQYRMYSNQFIPLIVNTDLVNRLRLQGLFDSSFSGGSICHINLDGEITKERMRQLIVTSAGMGVIYFAINLVINECENGHMFTGLCDCPLCGGKATSQFTRVVGFLTRVSTSIPERQELDFPNRQFYKSLDHTKKCNE